MNIGEIWVAHRKPLPSIRVVITRLDPLRDRVYFECLPPLSTGNFWHRDNFVRRFKKEKP